MLDRLAGNARHLLGVEHGLHRSGGRFLRDEHRAVDRGEEAWDALQKGVTGAGMLVSVAHRDFTASFGEAKAIAKHLAAHAGSESQLVRDLSSAHGTGFGMTASPTEVNEGTIAALEAAVVTVAEKAPDELDAYRALVLDVANAVAEAKGGVQGEETAAIERITAALA